MPRGYKSFEQSPPFFVNDGVGLCLPCEKKTTPLPTHAKTVSDTSISTDPAKTAKTADDLFWPENFPKERSSR